MTIYSHIRTSALTSSCKEFVLGMCIVCVLYVYCMCIVCVLYVYCMCIVCVLYVYCMCTVCVLYVYCMFSSYCVAACSADMSHGYRLTSCISNLGVHFCVYSVLLFIFL